MNNERMISRIKKLLGLAKGNRIREANDLVQLHRQYCAVFGTEDGQAVLADICKRNFVFDSAFSMNPQELASNEGRRYAVLSILRFLEKNENELNKSNETTAQS